jgi:hypothetical protein
MLKKLGSYYKRLFTSDVVYYEEQFMYGHREALLHFSRKNNSKLDDTSILLGSIDHGWYYSESIWKLRTRNPFKFANRYVWNDRQSELSNSAYRTVAVGAPWLYMLNNLGLDPTNIEVRLPKSKNKVIVFPGHNTGYLFSFDLLASIEEFKYLIPKNSEVTVCLFWLDFCDPFIRKAYQKQGWKVESVGATLRGFQPDILNGGRPTVLIEMFSLLKDASLFITDDISTGLFYALSLNLTVQFIETQSLKNFNKTWINHQKNYNPKALKNRKGFYSTAIDWATNYFHEIFETTTHPSKFLDFSWGELGYEAFKRNPMGEKFVWIPNRTKGDSLLKYSKRIEEERSSLLN